MDGPMFPAVVTFVTDFDLPPEVIVAATREEYEALRAERRGAYVALSRATSTESE